MTDEKTLIRAAQAGDRHAMDEIFNRYSGYVHRLANGLEYNPEDAADLAAVAMGQALKSLKWFDPDRGVRLKTWLYMITLNCFKDSCKLRSRSIATISITDPAIDETVSAPISHFDSDPAIAYCIQALSERYRKAITLYHLADQTIAEIADTLGCPEGTVQSRLHRARLQLRKCLERAHATAARELALPGDPK